MKHLILRTMSGIVEPLTDFDGVKRRQSVEGEKSLSFYLYKTDRNSQIFDLVQCKEKIELEGDKYVIDICDREPVGTSIEKYVEARHEMFDSLKGHFQKKVLSGSLQISTCLNLALQGTGLTYEVIGNFGSREFESFGRAKGLSLFQEVCKRFGVEYRVYGTHLIIAQEISRVTDAQFRHGHNLKSISEHIDTTDLATYGEGYGAIDEETGQYIVSVTYESPNSHLYRDENGNKKLYHMDYVYDERFYNEEALLEEVKSRMRDVPDYNLKVSYEELKKNGFKLHNFGLGDYVWSIYELMLLDILVRIISIEDYPFDPYISPVLELGSFRRDVTKTVASVQGAINNLGNGTTEARKASETAQNAAEEARIIADSSRISLTEHLEDFNRHITDMERFEWNNAELKANLYSSSVAGQAEANAKGYTDLKVADLTLIIDGLVQQIVDLTVRVEMLENEPE